MFILRFEAATPTDYLDQCAGEIARHGHDVHYVDKRGEKRNIPAQSRVAPGLYQQFNGIQDTFDIKTPYALASRTYQGENTSFLLGNSRIGGNELFIIGGPCAVESRSQYLESAHAVKEAGGNALRGAIFKPRTVPYSFQGIGEAGLTLLAEARKQTGLPIFTEVLSIEQAREVQDVIDVFQIGARNMQNFALLRAIGQLGKPALLKRGMGNTLDELLASAEYLLYHGTSNVILCERGIRTFENSTRFTFDLNALPVLKHSTHLPVIADPSHATGHHEYVEAVALGAAAAGAHGLLVELHPHPEKAKSDKEQALYPKEFAQLVKKAREIHAIIQQNAD